MTLDIDLIQEDLDRLFALRMEDEKHDMHLNEYARALLVRVLRKRHPEKVAGKVLK